MMVAAARVDTASTSTVYSGIGSNLGQPLEQVRRARDALAGLPGTRLIGVSPFYRNPAIGPGEQPEYVNAVAAIETRLGPHALLAALQAIETRQGRTRGAIRWQARTVDLDLLVYGDRAISDQRLTVPHPHIHERAFVLKPLLDIAPDLDVPGLGSVASLLARVADGSLRRIDDSGDIH